MCRMIRKVTFGAVVVAAGLMALSWLGLSSYPATAFNKIRQSAKKQVPLEFEIERLRYQVTQLVPDMRKNINGIAEMTVAVENLQREVGDARVSLDKQKDNVLAMTTALESGATTVAYRGRETSAARLKERLNGEFVAYQHAEAELKGKEKLLEARERELDAAREQLTTLKSQKQEMELEVARLEAELKTLRAVQARSNVQIDNTKLSQCKATLADIRNRLKIEKTATTLHNEFDGDAPASPKAEKSAKELTKEIKGYFGHPVTQGNVVDKN